MPSSSFDGVKYPEGIKILYPIVKKTKYCNFLYKPYLFCIKIHQRCTFTTVFKWYYLLYAFDSRRISSNHPVFFLTLNFWFLSAWGSKFRTVKFQNGWYFEFENERTCKCRMAELMSVTTIENKIYIKGQYENRQNCQWSGISNGRTIPKFANFWNFDNFPN